MAEASGVAQEFQIALPPKVKIQNSASWVYLSLYGNTVYQDRVTKILLQIKRPQDDTIVTVVEIRKSPKNGAWYRPLKT